MNPGLLIAVEYISAMIDSKVVFAGKNPKKPGCCEMEVVVGYGDVRYAPCN